ncbi:MAG: hypothetical protein IAF38_02725 [Bacteroidia bacterium]|nr:hypothetical protein [Bacteroidia bacterium]
MFKKLTLFIFCVNACGLFAQTVFYNKTTHKYGIKEKTGKISLKAEYDTILKLEYEGKNYFSGKKSGKVGLFSEKGTELLPCEYTSFPDLDVYSEPQNYSGTYSGYGDNLYLPEPKRIKNYLLVLKNGKNFFFNLSKNTLLATAFDSVKKYYDDSLIIAYNEGKAGVFNVPGNKLLVPFNYAALGINKFKGNYYIVSRLNDKAGIINMKNEILFPFEYYSLYFISPDFIEYFTEPDKKIKHEYGEYSYNKHGFTNLSRSYKTPCIYEFGNSFWFGDYDHSKEFYKKFCFVYADTMEASQKCGFLGADGKFFITPEYSFIKREIRFFGDRFVYLVKDKKVYDFSLENPSDCKYEEMGDNLSL